MSLSLPRSHHPCLGSRLIVLLWGALIVLLSVALVTIDPSTARAVSIVALQQATLRAPDAVPGDWFGQTLALSGDTVVVGVPNRSVAGHDQSGAAYIFARTGTSWSLQAELLDPSPAAGDAFGASVAVHGNYVLIGAPYRTVDGHMGVGCAFLYLRSGSSWAKVAELTPSDMVPWGMFGTKIVFDSTTALITAQGAAGYPDTEGPVIYCFSGSGSMWSEQSKIDDPRGPDMYSGFGGSLSLSGTTLLVGSPGKYFSGAYVYVRSGTSWSKQAELDNPGTYATEWDSFGAAAAISGNTVLIGDSTNEGPDDRGLAYAFVRSGTSWSLQATIAPVDPNAAAFGSSVAVSGDMALIGDPWYATPTAFHIFTRSGTSWTQQLVVPRPSGSNDSFGSSLRISGSTVAVGAPGMWTDDGSHGALCVYLLVTPPVNTVTPTVSGLPVVGRTMTCSAGTWTSSVAPTFTYQWQRAGVAISGATNSTYVVTSADLLKTLSCKVTAKNNAGSASATSKAVSVVPKLTLKVSVTSLTLGGTLTLSGTVANVVGSYKSVTIGRVTSSGTTTLKTLTLTATNTFSTTYKPTATGSWVFVAGYKGGTTTVYKSNTVTVSVKG